jgi:hypothetical protein
MTKKWTLNEIIMVVVLLTGLLNTALTTYTFQRSNKIYLFSAVNTIVFITLFFLIFQEGTLENFFFEVSPNRKKCLMEQVSRKNFGKKMPCNCCGKGTTGGIPPNYAQWLGKSDSDTSGWFRPDHVKYVDSFSNGEECKSSFTQPVYIQHI